MEADRKSNTADPPRKDSERIDRLVFLGTLLLVAAGLFWLIAGQVEFRKARFDRVKIAMTEAQVWLRMGPPEHEYTRVLLGPAIEQHAGPYEANYVTPSDQPTVHALASVVWQYYQAGVVFNEDGRVIAKWGKFYFD
jgi:hypothetical protein